MLTPMPQLTIKIKNITKDKSMSKLSYLKAKAECCIPIKMYIKATGSMVNFMVMEYSHGLMDPDTKASIKTVSNMVKDNWYILPRRDIKVIGSMVNKKEMVLYWVRMVTNYNRVDGKMAILWINDSCWWFNYFINNWPKCLNWQYQQLFNFFNTLISN